MPREYVYAIQMGETGPIKIGVSDDPRHRLETLQTGNPAPLRIVAMFSGGYALEQTLHRQCVKHRLNGEWFNPHADVLAAVRGEVERVGRVSPQLANPMWRYDRCSNCDALLRDSLGAVKDTGEAARLCDPCEEFAVLRASGVDPFAG